MRLKRANVCGPMVFGDGFRVCEAEAETGHKCHRGQARRARQEPDALRVEREIRVFPALAQTSTKNHCGHNAEASVRRVCGIYGEERKRNGINHTVSPLGREADQLCPPSEDLEDLERNRRNDGDVGEAERLSSLERRKRAVLNSSAEPIPCLRKAFMTD